MKDTRLRLVVRGEVFDVVAHEHRLLAERRLMREAIRAHPRQSEHRLLAEHRLVERGLGAGDETRNR